MAENPLLALHGHDYEAAGPSGDPNSAGYALEGPARPLSTADVLASLKSDSVVTRPMRGLAELLRAGARGPEDIPTPTHGKLVPFLLNAGAGGFDTAANWLDRRPKIGPDTIAPLGGMAAIAPITAVHGAAGVFGGRLAKTADHEALSRAELMAEHSFPRENIWKDTGWFQGRDGKWRFEIDDSGSRFNEVGNSVGDYLTHPGGMFKAYREVPGLGRDLGDIPLLRSGNANEGAYLRGEGIPPIEIVQVGKGSTDPRSIALHEYQHAIQQREGFARGANPGTYAGEHDALANPDAFQKYLRTAGEVEARNVQSRKDMTPSERRNVAPWETQDVADADQILRADNARASLPGVVIEGAAGNRSARTLEEYVDKLAQRPSVLDYETYLSDPLRTINGRSRTFETQEPQFKREVSQEAKNLSHWRNMDSLREKRDAGLMAGPEGSPVNPWYWPAPMFDAFKRELGDELAHDRLSKFMNYNASTSMQTAVPRNIIEAWHVLHHDLNGIPINKLNNAELTGETAHKIRNYSLNLHGVGTAQPEYAFKPGGEAERLLSPATLDSIMAEAMRLRTKAGEPSERFKGPIYREGVSTINKLGDEVGAAAADTQAAIWQQHQFAKHGTGVYQDSYARIFDDVIHRVAAERGEDPNKVLADLMHGRARPPNFFTLAADNARASLPGTIVNGLEQGQPLHAFHASPHKFDKFEWRPLTGEGANAYMPGHYFAENEAVSGKGGQYDKSFRMQPRYLDVGGETIPVPQGGLRQGMPAEERAAIWGRDLANPASVQLGVDPIARLERQVRESELGHPLTDFQKEGGWGDTDTLRRTADILREWKQRGVKTVDPNIYEVAINAKPNQLLDLDAPIKGQPDAIKDAIRKHYADWTSRDLVSQWTDTAKMSALDWVQKHPTTSNAGWVEALKDNGIVGARYLDGDSRKMQSEIKKWEGIREGTNKPWSALDWFPENADRADRILEKLRQRPEAIKPTSNYVMFPGTEDLIDILKRYGVAAPVAGGAVSGALRDSSSRDAGQ